MCLTTNDPGLLTNAQLLATRAERAAQAYARMLEAKGKLQGVRLSRNTLEISDPVAAGRLNVLLANLHDEADRAEAIWQGLAA